MSLKIEDLPSGTILDHGHTYSLILVGSDATHFRLFWLPSLSETSISDVKGVVESGLEAGHIRIVAHIDGNILVKELENGRRTK